MKVLITTDWYSSTGERRVSQSMKVESVGEFAMEKKAGLQFNFQTFVRWLSLAFLLACALIAIYLYRAGAFSSAEGLQELIASTGIVGAAPFFAVQAIQVVIPIIPGGVSCLAGVLLFGAWKGFLLNYLGICLGSCIAFFISRNVGKDLLRRLFSEKLITKYENWTEKQNRFTKLFAIAIFFPVAPDDFLCYLAGTTKMRWRQFIAIILLGKPLSIAAYSLGLQVICQQILALV